MGYFDYQKVAREAKIPADKMEQLIARVRVEFPDDALMYELHMLRVCMAIRDGHVAVEDALRPELSQGPPPK